MRDLRQIVASGPWPGIRLLPATHPGPCPQARPRLALRGCRDVSGLDAGRRVERASLRVHPVARVISGARAAGKAGAVMAGRAVRETVMLAGRVERIWVARAFVDGVLGPDDPRGDVAALLVDELFVNSLRHSGSGAPGETVTIAIKTANNVIRVEVTDLSGPGVPKPRPAGSDAEGAPAC
jgi:hypothetical protein